MAESKWNANELFIQQLAGQQLAGQQGQGLGDYYVLVKAAPPPRVDRPKVSKEWLDGARWLCEQNQQVAAVYFGPDDKLDWFAVNGDGGMNHLWTTVINRDIYTAQHLLFRDDPALPMNAVRFTRAELLASERGQSWEPKVGDLVRVVESAYPKATGQVMRIESRSTGELWNLVELQNSGPFGAVHWGLPKASTRLEHAADEGHKTQGVGGSADATSKPVPGAEPPAPSDPYQNFPHGMNEAQICVAQQTRDAERLAAMSPAAQRRLRRIAVARAELDREVGQVWENGWSGSSYED